MAFREELIYMAKVCEQTERFIDMKSYMKDVVLAGQPLSIDERNLLSLAYKNPVSQNRSAWRALVAAEQREESRGGKHLQQLRGYRKKIEEDLTLYCNEIIELVDKYLINRSDDPESQVFYLKLKADYYRYMGEYMIGPNKQAVAENASKNYSQATAIANEKLEPTNPLRLGLALNYSVFFYEIMEQVTEAITLSKKAFDDAIANIEKLTDAEYKDATTIMQLIRDNLTLWTASVNDENDSDK